MPFVLYSLFLTCLLPLFIAWITAYFRYRQFGNVDNAYPRAQQAELTGLGARAMAAQLNAWESAIIYGAAVFIAFAQGMDLDRLAWPAAVFLLARVGHAVFYLSNRSTLRSLSYVLGLLMCIYMALAAPFFSAAT